MDDGNGDQKINDTPQSDAKQNCVENTNSLPPSSDNCVAKKTSFEITSITEPNNDDNDEDSPDTDSHVQDHRTDNRHDSDLQNYAENIVVYNSSNDVGSSAPVIPTSSQYGLAIVDNSDSNHSGSIKNEDIHGVDASLQKSEGDLNGLQNKNRNERFKVVKIESTEPFKRGRWVCMDFLDHSMNQQQSGNNKLIMVNGENKAFSPANEPDNSTEPLDNGQQESTEFKVSTNNVSTYTTNCNTTDNYKNQTSAYNIVSSGVTTPIHSACVSPGQSLQTNMQVPVLTSQPIATPVQAPQPQSLTQVQIPAQHNVNQGCIPHSSLQSHQIQQVIANAGVMQPQLQQTQPVINVMQNQNSSIQAQSIQHLTSVDQHVTQTMPQYQQPMSQANVQQQIMQQHSIPAQFQKSFVPQNQSVLPNCAPLQPPVNQIINQQVPQYYNSPPIQSQNVTSESSTTVPMPNQHISQPYQPIPIQNQPLQSHVQLQQNQQQLPPPVQQMQTSPQQNMVQQNQMQPQMIQQNQQLSHQPSISQPSQPQQTQTVPQQTQQMSQQLIQQTQQTPQSQQTHVQQVTSSQQQGSQQMQQVGQQIQASQSTQIQQQLPQQTHHITQISQLTNQTQLPQSNQMQQQITQPNQQIPLQNQQIPQQAQLQHAKQIQTPQIQSQPQQINQQQISQITGQNQMIHQNNQQITHTGQMISQQTHNQGQQINQQNQVQQQQQQSQQPQPQIQQQITQTSQPSQPITQQILQPNQNMSQQNQVLPQQLGIGQSNSQMSVPQSQNQQVIQPQQSQHMQQSGQQYQQPQQMMQSQPQQLPMQTNQPIMHQPTYSQAQSLSSMQLQQAVMQIPTNTVTSTQMHIQQQQPVVQSNMMQQPQINVMPQNNNQPSGPMSQQQMTYSLQQHVPINQNYANMQNCYIPSQQQNIAPYKPSVKTVETVNKKKEDANSEDVDNGTPTTSGTNTVAIDNKIEQAMDLVKSHLMYAVREEVEVLKEKIAELMDKVGLLETENSNLRMLVPSEMLEQYNREKQKPTNSQSTHN